MFQSIERKHPHFYQYFRIVIVIAASILYAWNLCCFAKAANLFPGGFSGISLLLQKIGLTFFHIQIPFSLFNIILNLFPAYIAYRYIGKRFTLYSILVIFLSSIFVDILPQYIFTQDILLICIFGGMLNGLKCRYNNRRYGFHQYLSVPAKRRRCLELYPDRKCHYAADRRCTVRLEYRTVFHYLPVLQYAGHPDALQTLSEGNTVYYFRSCG